MRKYITAFLLFVFCVKMNGQTFQDNLSGQVSFVSFRNIYVKFKSTAGISAGDTLFIKSSDSLIPALIVKNLSSTSCACYPLSATMFSVADFIVARIVLPEKKNGDEVIKNTPELSPVQKIITDSVMKKSTPDKLKQKIKGSISLNSYSDISNTGADNSQRYRYTISLDARNIANSKFSFESYLSFKHKAGDWEEVKTNVFNALKIYDLAIRYDLNKTTQISLGRKINPRISSIGAIDGLQFEKSIKRFSLGALIGSRPDYQDYGFDSKLFQYGAYLAYNSKATGTYSGSSLAFMQQMNHSKTDRRFIYFQHSSSFIKNLNFFSTLEVDLYQLMTDSLNNEQHQNTFNLTGLYLSLSFKLLKAVNISGSYDARKNVIYYETYKTFFDRILENELRQGFRLQASFRITGDMILGFQSGYRYLKSDPHPSRNLYSYFTYSRIPLVNMSATLSATYFESGYMNGKIFGLTLSRDFFKGKVQTGAGYRYVDYRLPENSLDILQNIGELSLSWQPFKNMFFSMNYEGTFEQTNRYDRLYLQLRQRF